MSARMRIFVPGAISEDGPRQGMCASRSSYFTLSNSASKRIFLTQFDQVSFVRDIYFRSVLTFLTQSSIRRPGGFVSKDDVTVVLGSPPGSVERKDSRNG